MLRRVRKYLLVTNQWIPFGRWGENDFGSNGFDLFGKTNEWTWEFGLFRDNIAHRSRRSWCVVCGVGHDAMLSFCWGTGRTHFPGLFFSTARYPPPGAILLFTRSSTLFLSIAFACLSFYQHGESFIHGTCCRQGRADSDVDCRRDS